MSDQTTTVDAIEDAARKVDAVAALVECAGCACGHGYDFTEDMAAVLADELRRAVDGLHAAADDVTAAQKTPPAAPAPPNAG